VLYEFVGFLEKEIVKDGIDILDTGENPEAPASREMSDLEVCVIIRDSGCIYTVCGPSNITVYF